jgi:hypothetical protein
VDTLDQSDVIVYVEPKTDRQALGAYLSHSVVTTGSHRYLRIRMDLHGCSTD